MEPGRSGKTTFEPRARILKLIGAELISDDVLAVVELVKNAHDADAGHVRIEFRGVTEPGGEIVISDDGHGMTLDDLLERWMQPGHSLKASAGGRMTRRGRRALGEKGVGRFAADKLASRLELTSRPLKPSVEVCAKFDWDEFAAPDKMLSDVASRWELLARARGSGTGTTLRLQGLRSRWTERMFRRVSVRLQRLVSPFAGPGDFSIELLSGEFPDYAGAVRSSVLEHAPYRLEALLTDEQVFDVSIDGAPHRPVPWNGPAPLRCGPLRLRLYAFDLETSAIARLGPRMEVRAWLREWSGVSIYRDGFRVWPYGEPHDDWLRLDQRRVNNPVLRLSNNQLVGFVEIGADTNPHLRDRTNREGIVQGRALDDLRRAVIHSLSIVEAHRQTIRHPRRPARTRSTGGGANGVDVLERIRSLELAGGRNGRRELGEVAGVVKRAIERRDEQIDLLRRHYIERAAIGQAIRDIHSESLMLPRSSRADVLPGLLSAWTELLGRLSLSATGRPRTIDAGRELMLAKPALERRLRPHGIKVEFVLDADLPTRVLAPPATLHAITGLIASNSIHWLRDRDGARFRLSVANCDGTGRVRFSDNGPGIAAALAARVFEPGFSTREDGQGMGLALARELAEQRGGTLEVLVDGRRRGACLQLSLPLRRSRATRSLE